MADEAIKGGKELDAFLQSLPVKVEKNILRSALRQGANVIRTEAKALVPVKTGMLYKSIRVSVRYKRGRVTASIKAGGTGGPYKTVESRPDGSVKITYNDAYYARFVEFGTKPHYVRSEKTKAMMLVPNKVASSGFAKRLVITSETGKMHPGANPKPFMRPALDASSGSAIEAIVAQIRARLTKEGINAPAPEVE
jgi:HK97 gp10 family phage protein